jgi:hypothetical protein
MAERSLSVWRYAGQALWLALFAGALGYFSVRPLYTPYAPQDALLRISFTHAAKPVGECRTLSQDELAQLPPNMRIPVQCPRERSPVEFVAELDGRPLLTTTLPPTGFARDGAAVLYDRHTVRAGAHRLSVKLKDDARARDFGYQRDELVTFLPGQVLVIDFDPRRGGFVFK